MSDLWRKPAHELAALVRKREISPVELLDAHLAVIDRLNPTLNAIVTLAADSARAAARTAEQVVTRGDKLGAAARPADRHQGYRRDREYSDDLRLSALCRQRPHRRC